LAEGHTQLFALIPEISLIIGDTVPLKKLPKLFLKCLLAMMFHLIANVPFGIGKVDGADGKHSIPALPVKVTVFGTKRFHELRRFSFDLFDEIHRCVLFTHVEQNVNVVDHSSDDDIWRIDTPYHLGKITVHTGPNLFIEKGRTVFGTENQVGVDFREGLRHFGLLA
jgi:hypothetical protein